uniref:Uncharacterized protein n=1 Tax=Ditylenchus dipsaci TaxID=166011 RepID=A0A915CU24_9BILA
MGNDSAEIDSLLNYLTLQLGSSVLNHFVQVVRNSSHLEALELYIGEDSEDMWTDELFDVIVSKCLSLKHLGLTLSPVLTVSGEKLALVAGLPSLCSVYIHSDSYASLSFPIFALFEELSISGRLQYFDTSEVLFPEQICQALIGCKDLTGLFCAQTEVRSKGCINFLLVTLEKIHQGEQLPATTNDERILHTNYGSDIKRQ